MIKTQFYMKKVFAILALVTLVLSLGLSSCSTAKPCPAYTKANTSEVRA